MDNTNIFSTNSAHTLSGSDKMPTAKDIFVRQEESNDISGKITVTNILEMMPGDTLKKPIPNWENEYKTEWRWRFLDLTPEKQVLELSYITNGQRLYFNRYGQWVERNIDPIYDKYVKDEYYFYTK